MIHGTKPLQERHGSRVLPRPGFSRSSDQVASQTHNPHGCLLRSEQGPTADHRHSLQPCHSHPLPFISHSSPPPSFVPLHSLGVPYLLLRLVSSSLRGGVAWYGSCRLHFRSLNIRFRSRFVFVFLDSYTDGAGDLTTSLLFFLPAFCRHISKISRPTPVSSLGSILFLINIPQSRLD